jgi:glycosyltransferase involved in cell wall biosynthesis
MLHVALLISLYFPPETNGGASGAWNRAMILHKIGYSVYIVCGFPAYPSGKVKDPKYKGKFFCIETIEHFKVIRLRLISISHDGYIKRLVIFLNFIALTMFYMPRISRIIGKVDIIYSRAPIIFSSFIGFLYSKFTKSFFIYEAPDLWPEELVVFRTPLSPLIMSGGKLAAKLSYALPDMIVTISDSAADIISSEYKPKAPVYGLPVGVDPEKFTRLSKSYSRIELIKKNILPPTLQNKFIILYTGKISNAQRIETLAYAAEQLKDEKEIAIVIIGEGPEKTRLHHLKNKRDLDNFYILPSQPKEIMPYVISAADLCTVLLSPEPIFSILFPTKFYEYLACGKPLIGICGGELADIVDRDNIGRIVKFGDITSLVSTIKHIKNTPDIMQIMENNTHFTLNRFSLDSITSVFQNILKSQIHK